MARKPISIRLSLLLYGFIPMIISTILYSAVILTLTDRLIKQREETALITNTRILSDLLDNELRKIKRVSLNLAYSPSLRGDIQEYISLVTGDSDSIQRYYGARAIQGELLETIGPLKQVEQVNIILSDSDMVCAGQYNLSQKVPNLLQTRINNLRADEVTTYWSPPERDYLAESLGDAAPGQLYVSYYQVLFDDYRNRVGYIEVKQEVNTLFAPLKNNSENFKVFNKLKRQIYPSTEPYGNAYSNNVSGVSPYEVLRSVNKYSHRNEILCPGFSTEAPWNLVNIIDENEYLKPIKNILLLLISLIIIISVLSFLVSHRLSQGISRPLMNFSRKLDQMEWSRSPSDRAMPDVSSIMELNNLEVSFAEMNRKMDEKLDLFVAEKTLEVNARMLALQSHDGPPFPFQYAEHHQHNGRGGSEGRYTEGNQPPE